jgi:hypothetical protein
MASKMHIFDVYLQKIFPGAKRPDPRREGIPLPHPPPFPSNHPPPLNPRSATACSVCTSGCVCWLSCITNLLFSVTVKMASLDEHIHLQV